MDSPCKDSGRLWADINLICFISKRNPSVLFMKKLLLAVLKNLGGKKTIKRWNR